MQADSSTLLATLAVFLVSYLVFRWLHSTTYQVFYALLVPYYDALTEFT